MAVNLRAGYSQYTWTLTDIWKDCPECITHFEQKRKEHPTYQLTDGNRLGETLLMSAMGYGNLSLLSHLVKLMDKHQINMWNVHGETIFENLLTYIHVDTINKILECTKHILEAGADINLANEKGVAPLDALLDEAPLHSYGHCMRPLIKLYIKAGAHVPTEGHSTNPLYLQVQEEILEENWLKTRNIYSVDPGSAFYPLPKEIRHLISQAFIFLPDIAQPPQGN